MGSGSWGTATAKVLVDAGVDTTMWARRPELAEAVNAGNDTALRALAQLQAAGQSAEQANAVLERLIDQQAHTMAVTDIFLLSSGLFVLLVATVVAMAALIGSANSRHATNSGCTSSSDPYDRASAWNT